MVKSWPIARIIALTAIILAAVTSIVQWQLNSIDKRLEERLSIYQQEQTNTQRRVERVEDQINRMERKPQ
jgi:peptidoglycan hydrolase CwlO-like protein